MTYLDTCESGECCCVCETLCSYETRVYCEGFLPQEEAFIRGRFLPQSRLRLTLMLAIGSVRPRDFARRLCLLFDLCRI